MHGLGSVDQPSNEAPLQTLCFKMHLHLNYKWPWPKRCTMFNIRLPRNGVCGIFFSIIYHLKNQVLVTQAEKKCVFKIRSYINKIRFSDVTYCMHNLGQRLLIIIVWLEQLMHKGPNCYLPSYWVPCSIQWGSMLEDAENSTWHIFGTTCISNLISKSA